MTATVPTHADASATERAAAARASRWAGSLEARVLRALADAGTDGLTAHEARAALGLPLAKHYSVAPRLSVMSKHKGWVARTDEERGVEQVYRITDAGRAQLGLPPATPAPGPATGPATEPRAGRVVIAPVGADPTVPEAWTELGQGVLFAGVPAPVQEA